MFILLTTLALIAAARFRDGGRRSALLWAAVFTALACLTRYMGVAILLTVVVVLLFTDQRRPEKAQNMAWYSLIAVAPPAAVLLLNQLFIGTFNSNPPSETTLPAILSSMAEALASWLLPVPGSWMNDNVMLAAPLGLLTLAPVAMVGVMAVRRRRVPGRWRSALVVPAAFTLLYLALLLTAATVSRLGGLPDRYLSPVYVPLLLIVAGLAAYWLRRNVRPANPGAELDRREQPGAARRAQRARTARRLAPPLLLFLWLAYPVAATAIDINRALADGTGRQYDPRWVNSALIQYIAHHLDGIDYNRLYSNDEHIPYFHAGVPTRLLPINRNELRQVYHNRTAAAGVYVVWLENVHSHPRDYGRNELEESLPYPQLLFEDNDGALFYVSSASIAESIAAVARATAAAIYADAQQLDGPAISAAYDVYIADDRLIYIKEPCADADTAETFYLHLHPAPADRPKPNEPIPQYGYHNLDFEFDRYGLKVGARCMISVPYSGYEIARIRTGQYTAAGPVWESGVDFRLSAFQQMQLNDLAARQPVSRQRFAVYLLDGELAYLKEPCAPADTAAPFYLHIVPANSDALPAAQREYGYDNRDFAFDAAGWSFEGQCLATAPLPEYDIARIRTGQYTAAGRLWESEFAVGAR